MNDKKMEAAVVGAIIGPTISVVLQNLLSLSVEEISNILGFKKDLKRLKDSFYMIQDFLSDAEAQQITNKAVKRWLKNLEAVAFDADNLLDEFNYQLLRQKVETQNHFKKKKVQSFFSGSNSFAFRRKMGKKIKDIKERLEIINQEASGFGLQKGVMMGPNAPTVPVRQQTDSFALDPIVIGRENDVSKIVEMINTCPVEEFVCVIPIVGMGGIGKTTLARLVWNDQRINKRHFPKKIWVCVSENFDPTTLFKMILESLTAQSVQVGTREAVLKRLWQNLKGQRYLLVLDDVWNEDNDKWEDFVNSLSGMTSAKGNCIIVTTRSKKVVSVVRTLPVHELSSLSEDNCWSIIKAKSFKGKDVPAEFLKVGKCIAQRCQGLPLVAKVIGGLLLDKSKEEWLSILETRLSDFGGDENRVLKILKLSFDHLPGPSLKKCFAYCAVFPKDFRMVKGQLIKLWMAEGFLQTDQINDMETIGNKFFNHLLQSSLFQDGYRDDRGNVTSCEMHDLVHDLACSVSDSQSIHVNDSDSTADTIPLVQHLSVNCVGDQPYTIQKERAKYLRTLFFDGKISDSMFLDFKCLHSLTVMGKHIEELPDSIGKLVHLRYLGISNTRIKLFPESIGKLYQLQTLLVQETNRELDSKRLLPNTLVNLILLRHLCIPFYIELPPQIGQLAHLRTLECFWVGYEKGCRIEELGSLKNLNGKLLIRNLERVKDKEEAKSADLFGKPNIISLVLIWNEPRDDGTIDENVLDGLQPCPNLEFLSIIGFNGKKFPLWAMKMAVHNDIEGHWLDLDNLMELNLSGCHDLEEIPMLGHLPCLKFLSLHGLTNIRCIGLSFYGIKNCSSNRNGIGQETVPTLFPALTSLGLSKMENLTEWIEVQVASDSVKVFPCLKELKISDCHQLKCVPCYFTCLQELKIISVHSHLPLENICNVNLNSLKNLTIHHASEMINLPDELFDKNQNFSYLDIYSCPNITHLVPQFNGASLTGLSISNCENLRELPDDFYSIKSLRTIIIDRCPNLTSISYPNEQSQGFTSLVWLEITNCEELTNLPSAMLETCTSLESLQVYDCPKLTSFQVDLHRMINLFCLDISQNPKLDSLPRGIDSIRLLETLKIGPFSESLSFDSFSGTLHGVQGLQSLKSIVLYGWEHWDSLPDLLQHLSSLLSLEIWDFGIEDLPEWFQNLSSLQYLNLHKCARLRHLPSKEAMQRLKNIRELSINNCPLLKERYDQLQRDDPEWLGISHIPQVYIDEQLTQFPQ